MGNKSYTMELTEATNARLEALMEREATDMGTVLRRGLALYESLSLATKGGGKVFVRYPNGDERGVEMP